MNSQNEFPAELDRSKEALRQYVADLEIKVSELTAVEKSLRESERKYRLIIDHSGDCLWTMDLASLRFTYVSPSVTQIYGFTPEETMQRSITDVIPPHSLEIVAKVLAEEMELDAKGLADPNRTRTIEIEEYKKDGSLIWIENVLSFLRDGQRKPTAILGISRNITERRRLMDQLHKLAATDSLTGAYNRRHFLDQLRREVSRSKRYSYPFSLIMLDIDYFKTVNDHFGHETGDRVLEELVTLIRRRIRTSDLLARWGGEEFLIMLINTPLLKAVALANDLSGMLRNHTFPVIESLTASFGVAQYRNCESIDSLLTRVDNLMYQAKHEGRDRINHDSAPIVDLEAS